MRLYGKNPVLERIRIAPKTIKKLHLQKRTDLSEIVKEAKKAGLKFESVDKAWIKSECGDTHTQGVMAEVEEFAYSPFSEILADCLDGSTTPVFLDGITDPQNLGAIIRNLACLGNLSLVIPEHESAHVNETVLRVANGGENHIKIAMVTNIATAVGKTKEEGVWIAGAVVEGSKDILSADLTFPMAAVIGSEGKGIRPGVRKHLDEGLALPMQGASLSYNVSVAASLFCYEINRRKWRN
ncbi:23S rRNA (guanosine(2251)-2'-O)-methyltransferase RlmB [Candidatus Omnitrophota bacterium]